MELLLTALLVLMILVLLSLMPARRRDEPLSKQNV
jgi:hypothetical protein